MSDRSLLVKQLPCICCEMEKLPGQCGPTEEHHLNLGGKAGQKRRGEKFSIPLGRWHHRGEPPGKLTVSQAAAVYGPSLAKASKKFRDRYGTDDELLQLTNERLAKL